MVTKKPHTLVDLQEVVEKWSTEVFGAPTLADGTRNIKRQPIISIMEEAGELARCEHKMNQGIRGTPEYWHEQKKLEASQTLFSLLDYAAINGFDLFEEALTYLPKWLEYDPRKRKADNETK